MCSCRQKNTCPMNGNCLEKSIIYKASVESEGKSMTYYGLTENQFKFRYNNHTDSFRHKRKENQSKLSKYIWKLKDSKKPYNILWSVAARASPYRCGMRRCDLCLTEKIVIIQADPKTLLNKRTELISKFRHRNKFCVKNIK